MSLKSLDEHNQQALERFRAAQKPRATGIACPACGTEMLDDGGGDFLSKPPKRAISCPSCGKQAMMIVG